MPKTALNNVSSAICRIDLVNKMERLFQLTAAILAAVAVYLLWNGMPDSAFVAAVMGCVAFFISVRVQVKARNKIREDEMLAAQEAGEQDHRSTI